MSNHTPGPWIVALNDGNLSVRSEATDETVAAFTHVYPECVFGLDEDDARLIAAAPDLLEALHALLPALMSKSAMMSKADWSAVEKANAAIAKARGEKQ